MSTTPDPAYPGNPSLPREVAFDQAPEVGDEGFLVPSPQA